MNRIWLQNYPEGIPHDITDMANQYSSVTEVINQTCQRYASRYAYQCMGAAITYSEMQHYAVTLAAWLQSKGVKKGDRVALMMPNLLQYPVAIYAVMLAGACVVNVNPLYTSHELQQQLKDADAKTIIIADNFAHKLASVLPITPVSTVIVTGIGDLMGGLKGWFTNFAVKHIKKLVPAWNIPNAYYLKSIFAKNLHNSFKPVDTKHSDMACLQYTGGTTGKAKGAILTHGNLVSNLCQAYSWVKPHLSNSHQDCIVTALPLYHIFAFTANFLLFAHLGAKNVLIVIARDIPAMVKDLKNVPFTAITGVNTLFNGLLNNKDFYKLDFSKLKWALGGGMAVQTAVAKKWLEATGKPITQAYGLTETSPAVCINPMDSTDFNGSIGLPVPSTDVVIRNNGTENLGVNEQGELCVRGPQLSPGYWNNDQETANAYDEDGFFRTGDIARMDEKGYFYIMDRKKDMILVSGFNVYPNEVEEVATSHPDIIEAAAIGIPDQHSGEAVKLFVISRNFALTEQEVIEYCRNQLTGYKVPKSVEFREDLPRTNVGKVLRRVLKEEQQ